MIGWLKKRREKSRLEARFLIKMALHQRGPLSGFYICKETGLRSGTIYPALAELEREGQVSSEWGPVMENGLRRRFYRLTGAAS